MKHLFFMRILLLAILVSVPLFGCKNNGTQEQVQQAGPVVVRYVKNMDLSLSVGDAMWEKAAPFRANLTQQNIILPNGGGSVRSVTVRALHNGTKVTFLLQWSDNTKDLENGLDTFKDAVAMAFPIKMSDTQPSPFMGDESNPVNIWQWRSDWQAEIDGNRNLSKRQPLTAGVWISPLDKQVLKKRYPGGSPTAPVMEFIAKGYGTLTKQNQQDVKGRGEHKNGKWSVVFERDLNRTEEADAIFVPGKKTLINFAVWNGSKNDVDGKKSISLFWFPLSVDSST